MNSQEIAVLIPCRMESVRFPGKPLAPIDGIPMVVRCAQNAIKSGFKTYICTDSRVIEETAKMYDLPVIITPQFNTGTDRVCWAAKNLKEKIIINLQGDEPLISSNAIEKFGEQCRVYCNNEVTILNGVTRLDPKRAFDPNNVKVALGQSTKIAYLSRKAIRSFDVNSGIVYVKQLGMYGFTQSTLNNFSTMPQSPLEITEKIEMLRWIDNEKILLSCMINCESISVDTPEDLAEVEEILSKA